MIPGVGHTIDIAFETAPDAAIPKWVDVSIYTLMAPGVSITRGRSPEGGAVSPGVCTLVLKNDDGRFTPENTGSPYYPNVTMNRRLRVRWRDPANLGLGNIVPAEDSGFEGGTIGNWNPNTFGQEAPAGLTNDATHVDTGTKAMKITWGNAPTGATGCFDAIDVVIGRTYTFRARVYVPTGSPDVRFGDIFARTTLPSTSTKDAYVTLTATFTATASPYFFGVLPLGATTAGQAVWLDSFMIDEGTSLGAYTTTPPVFWDRYVGFIHSWPNRWPSGPALARTSIIAGDRLKRIARQRKLRSVIEEEVLLEPALAAYYPCGEPDGSTAAGDVSAKGKATSLSVVQIVSGGTIQFGAGTGPPTDGLTAPVFTPTDATHGKILRATAPGGFNPGFFGSGISVECDIATTATSRRILSIMDGYGTSIALEVSPTGKLRVFADSSGFFGTTETVDSANSMNDGGTHHVAFTATTSSSGSTILGYLDGVQVIALTPGLVYKGWLPLFATLDVGGASGSLIAATISHVAVTGDVLTAARLLAHRTAASTGFSGERSDQRVARYAAYAGVAPADMTLDTGLSTSIAHVDTTDQTVLELCQKVEQTESGVLFVDTSGELRFHARSRRYNATPVSVAATFGKQDSAETTFDDQYFINDLTASREGGITYRAVSQSSIDANGVSNEEIQLLTTSDLEVIDAANWFVNKNASPRSKLPSIALNLLDDGIRSTLLPVDISTLLRLTALPSQAPASSLDVFVEGYTETISDTEWTLSPNLSPAGQSRVWQLGAAGSSELDTTTRLAY